MIQSIIMMGVRVGSYPALLVFYAFLSCATNLMRTVIRTRWDIQWQTSLCPFSLQIPSALEIFAFKREEKKK